MKVRITRWNEIGKRISCIALIGMLIVNGMITFPVKAARKPTLSVNKVVIPIGKQQKSNFSVLNKKSGAQYTFKTSNKKIVKVNSKGVLIGVKSGKANIIVNQKFKKKITKIGTVKVTVKKACALKKNTQTFTYGRERVSVKLGQFIKYINPDATYKLVSSDTGIAKSVSLKKGDSYAGTIALKKSGTVTFTIKETYQKKTTAICQFKILVKKATFDTKAFMEKYEIVDEEIEFEPLEFISYATSDDNFRMESSNSDVLEVNGDKVLALSEGESILTVYNGEETLASVKIKVKYVKITGVKVSTSKVEIYMGATAEESVSSFTIEPIPSGGKLTNCQVISLDESICSVNFDPVNGKEVEVIGEGEGKTSVLIKNKEDQTLKTIPITVVDALNTTVASIETSTQALTVNIDEEEASFTFTTFPSYSYANNCSVEVEDMSVCNATLEEVAENSAMARVCVTGYTYGITNVIIRNQAEKVLATIPVKVVDTGYIVPRDIQVETTTVHVYKGDIADFTYTVKTEGAKADYCMIEVENPEICTVQYMNEGKIGNLQITPISVGTTKFYIKSLEGTILKTIIVNIAEQPE